MTDILIKEIQDSPFRNGVFINGTFKGKYFTAKNIGVPAREGINGSCINKLSITKGDKWDGDNELFNFDQGLDFSKLHSSEINELLYQLEIYFELPERLPCNKVPEYCRV